MLILISLFSAIIPIFIYLVLLWYFDKNERESFILVFVNFLWGAFGSIVVALIVSILFSLPLNLTGLSKHVANFYQTVIVAPFVEEFAKGVFLFIIVITNDFDNLTDGLVYGGAIGLGFGMTENFLYYISFASTVNQLIYLFFLRTLFTVFIHLFATGAFGAFLALAKFSNKKNKIFLIIAGYLTAVFIHLIWNLSVTLNLGIIFSFVYMLSVFTIFIFTFSKSLKNEKKIISEELKEEILFNNITEGQFSFIFGKNKLSADRKLKSMLRKSAVKLAFSKHKFKNKNITNKKKYEQDILIYRSRLKSYLNELTLL